MKHRVIWIYLSLALMPEIACADWQKEIGLTRLRLLNATELPTNVSAGLTQVEAKENQTNYAPDTTSAQFAGKTFTLKSSTTGISAHANQVGSLFYGSDGVLTGNSDVDLYDATPWLQGGFLNYGTNSIPKTETRAVQNHSWVGSFGNTIDQEILLRTDYAIQSNGFVCVVGVNNGPSSTLPNLLCQAYNTLSVGTTNGNHSAGLTTLTQAGRIKPEIVAPENYTSYSTPMVAGTAGILASKLVADYSIASNNRPPIVKALLMGTATHDSLPGWGHTPTSPLDDVYGAGTLNAYHAYTALRAGKATASTNICYSIRGWAAESVSETTTKTYHFSIPENSVPTPFKAALSWHRNVASSLSFGIRTWTSTVSNLTLKLYQTDGFSLGSQIAASHSTVDNLQLISQPALPPGTYALVVETTSPLPVFYGLTWHSLPTVTVTASAPIANEATGTNGAFTFTRTGDTTLPLLVPISTDGTAASGIHFQALPESVIIPATQQSLTINISPITNPIAQGDRTLRVSIANDFGLLHSSDSATVMIKDTTFGNWKFSHFTESELNDSNISGSKADPDHDGFSNLLEYAFGMNPKTSSVSPFQQSISSGYLTLSAAKNPAASELNWSAEVSGNLETWTPAVIVTETPNQIIARDPVPSSDGGSRFIRFKVTQP